MPAFNQAELLKSLKPKLLAIAATYSSDRHTQEDLCQEAWIEIWKYFSKNPEDAETKSKKFFGMMAKRKMHDIIIRGYKTFGASSEKRTRGAIINDIPVSLYYKEMSSISRIWESLQTTNDDLELAYHNGEIADAIQSLPSRQREVIELMYWKGLTAQEVKREHRIDRNTYVEAKRKLREKLQHLKGAS